MKSRSKKISVVFSLLLILIVSLSFVSADDLEASDTLEENQVSDYELDLAESDLVSGDGHPDSPSPVSGYVIPSGTGYNSIHKPDSSTHGNQAIVIVGGENNIISSNTIKDSSGMDYNSPNLKAVSHDYSISVNDVVATEKTNVNIIANVKDCGSSVNNGFVRFLLWNDGNADVDEWVPVENGQGTLTIKLPSASNLSSLNWLCLAAFYDESGYYQANTTFMTQIKRAVNPTTVLTSNIVGKMGKKVTLVAKVYDTDGLKVNSGTLTFTVNGKSYKVSVKNGKASKTITTPFLGIYTVKAKYNGIGAYKPSSSKFKLASDLKMKYSYYKTFTVKKGAKKYYKITLTNYYTKKPLKSFKIKFKVKTKKTWKTYTLKSNSKGIIKWSTKKLSVGTHNVKICSPYKYMKFTLKGKIIVKKK